MLVAIRSRLFRKSRNVHSLRKNEDGAAAVEFALVALPFFGLIFAVIEIGIFFFASRYLEDGVFNAGRKALTQSLSAGSSCTDFKNAIANNVGSWLDKTKLVIDVSLLSSFNASATALDLNGGGCSLGGSGQTILIQVSYPYPFTGFRFLSGSSAIGVNMPLSAATALRVE